MDAERWRAVQEVLDAVLDAPVVERRAMLDRLTDPELRAEVEELMALEDEASTFLDGPAVPQPVGGLVGQRIGPYRIEAVLGRGGMGAVYRAVRVDDYDQVVAIKRVAPSVGGRTALRRFHAERQILARLEHPHIARLLDGGTDASGQPYLVMEYVDGTPIDRWCDKRRLDIDDRLRLFQQVADAVAYAHRNLIVHRDLKPANVLVTEDGTVKLLDFGIAKLLEADGATSAAAITRSSERPMTPLWASPEQVKGTPITTASDIYTLGLLLHHSLTGRLPGDLEGRSVPEIARFVCEVDATRPSALVLRDGVHMPRDSGEPILIRPVAEDLAYRRGCDIQALSRGLRGDLDAIVLRCLRKSPHDRYATVERLAEDITFQQQGRPVRARGDAFSYHARTLLRRHWRALVAALLTIAIGATMAAREVARLDAERREAREVAEFLKGLVAIADPDADALTADRILDQARDQLDGLDADPDLGAELADVLAGIYRKRGHYDTARELLARSVALARQGNGGELPQRLNNLAAVLVDQAAYAEAGGLLRESLDTLDRRGEGASPLA
ncbi:MAG: serine/threonine-protein kinase, partial [Acidobacteriota bacterium]